MVEKRKGSYACQSPYAFSGTNFERLPVYKSIEDLIHLTSQSSRLAVLTPQKAGAGKGSQMQGVEVVHTVPAGHLGDTFADARFVYVQTDDNGTHDQYAARSLPDRDFIFILLLLYAGLMTLMSQ